MAPADHTYRVRPASAADLPASWRCSQKTRPGRPCLSPRRAGPSDRQKAAWERLLATADLTVYLAETGAEAAGTASMLLMPHLTYDCRVRPDSGRIERYCSLLVHFPRLGVAQRPD